MLLCLYCFFRFLLEYIFCSFLSIGRISHIQESAWRGVLIFPSLGHLLICRRPFWRLLDLLELGWCPLVSWEDCILWIPEWTPGSQADYPCECLCSWRCLQAVDTQANFKKLGNTVLSSCDGITRRKGSRFLDCSISWRRLLVKSCNNEGDRWCAEVLAVTSIWFFAYPLEHWASWWIFSSQSKFQVWTNSSSIKDRFTLMLVRY